MRTRGVLAALAIGGWLAGCGQPAPAPKPAAQDADAEAGYVAAPRLTAAAPDPAGVRLEGAAAPGARVRLREPGAAAIPARSDSRGRWRTQLPPMEQPRVFGLSMTLGDRTVQADGYVMVLPDGRAAVLRAGAGAVLVGGPPGPRIAAFDFDRQGGAVVSGVVEPGASVSVRLDGRQMALGRAGPDGRFSIALTRPVGGGAHQVEAVGDAFRSAVTVDTSPPAPLPTPPLRTAVAAGGVRADWLTPGGGLQSTWIFN